MSCDTGDMCEITQSADPLCRPSPAPIFFFAFVLSDEEDFISGGEGVSLAELPVRAHYTVPPPFFPYRLVWSDACPWVRGIHGALSFFQGYLSFPKAF